MNRLRRTAVLLGAVLALLGPLAGCGGGDSAPRADDGPATQAFADGAAVATLDAQARHFLDEGLQRNTRYTYRVRAEGTAQQAESTVDTGEEAPLVTAVGAATGDPVARKVGSAGGVRLQLEGALAKPLLLTIAYAESQSADADGLGVALQRADGS